MQSHRGDAPVRYHNFAARDQRYKLVHPSGFHLESFDGEPHFELYDMAADPLEMRDIAAERPEVVARLRRAYDEWFDDVGATRPDNYAPPRIHIGTPHENPTILTRQDWRKSREAHGRWELHVAAAGTFDVVLRLMPNTRAGQVTLSVGGLEATRPVPEEASEVAFKLSLPAGDTQLSSTPPAHSAVVTARAQ